MPERITIDAQTGIIVGGINETVFNERIANFAAILQSVKDEIAEHQAQIENLQKRAKAVECYLADAAKINEIVERMKVRETEGI